MDSLEALAALMADLQPPPIKCAPQSGWDVAIAVPEVPWPVGSVVNISIRPGVINAPGGGLCGIMDGSVTAPDSQVSESVSLAQPPLCVPVPEIGTGLGLVVGVLAIVFGVWVRRRVG